MNKQMKVALLVIAILSTTTLVAYAAPPTTPNLSALIQNIMDYLVDYIYPGITGIQSDVDTIDAQLANIPVMESIIEEKSGERGEADPEYDVLYYTDWYPDGAIFHVTLHGTANVWGSEVYITLYFPQGESSVTTNLVERIAADPSVDVGTVVAEFAAARCQISTHLPVSGSYHVWYCVTVTHIP